MRKKILFMSMLASLFMVGCSQEEVNGGTDTVESGTSYVAVNIAQPKSAGTRANENKNFVDGTSNENKAETGLFFIYNSTGTEMYGNPQTVNLVNGDTPASGAPQVEKIYSAVLVVDGVEKKPGNVYQIVCVLNAPDEVKKLDKTTPLSSLRNKVNDYGTSEPGTFIMTNSVYKSGDKEVCGAVVTADDFKESASEALKNPVEIYVERVVAKIQVKKGENFYNNGAEPIVDGEKTKLTINVTGIEVANIANESYLFKKINDISYTWDWNDVANKRSYWETVPSSLTFTNKKYNDIVIKDFDIASMELFTSYIQPNTTSTNKTSILVTAELMNDKNPADLAYIRGGYTTKDGAKKIIAAYLLKNGYYNIDENNEYTPILPANLEWKNNADLPADGQVKGLKSYEVFAQVKSTAENLYKKVDGEYQKVENISEINTLLKSGTDAKLYFARLYGPDEKNAKCLCYYFVNIDQTPVATDNSYSGSDKLEGVIRNHIYDLTLTSIEGLGIPVFDPEDVIIPEIPTNEDLYYLGARINVLKWRLVSQKVEFKGE